MEDKKRKRAPNYSSREREVLLNIISLHKNIIENKKSDAVSSNDKSVAWFEITQKFNSLSPNNVFRTTESLKKYYENLKEDLRKRAGEEKKSLYKTGGGPPSPKSKVADDDILLDIVNKKTVWWLKNPFDSDSLGENIAAGTSRYVDLNEDEDKGDGRNINDIKIVYECPELMHETWDERSSDKNLSKTQASFYESNKENNKETETRAENWARVKASDLKKPLNERLQKNIKLTYTSKNQSGLKKTKYKKAPVVRALSSSRLGEKYEELIIKKLELAEGLRKEHELRMILLRFDIALKKKELLKAGYKDVDVELLQSAELVL